MNAALTLNLPTPDGAVRPYTLSGATAPPPPPAPPRDRTAYAAAHVVADPRADNAPGAPAALDWDATLAFRRYLWSLGLGVADAMDTAQRGMGLDWATTAELIRRSAAEARDCGGSLVVGVGTDHTAARLGSLAEVTAAYTEQLQVATEAGVRPVLMASRQLAALAHGPDDYATVYGRLLTQVDQPVVLHWLGEAFDPQLAGYWGHSGAADAVPTIAALITEHAAAVDGIKVSVLDEALEVRLRDLLPAGVKLYTGDDFNYPTLIKGDAAGHSHALLGIFAAIGPVAAAALRALDDGDTGGYDKLMDPTVALSRHLFAAPTYYYKTGVAFLAWLNGHQPGLTMVSGLHSARSIPHLAQTLRLADAAGALLDPRLAADRMRLLLRLAGVEQ